MASGPITSWQTDVETVKDFIFLGSKITADSDCSHEIKRCLLPGRKAMTNLDSILFFVCFLFSCNKKELLGGLSNIRWITTMAKICHFSNALLSTVIAIISFNPHNSLMSCTLLSFLFYRWENWAYRIPKVTGLIHRKRYRLFTVTFGSSYLNRKSLSLSKSALSLSVIPDSTLLIKRRGITLPTKVGTIKATVFPAVMYGCDSWTIKKAECQRIDA